MDAQYDLVQAILFIRPDAEFAVRNMGIEWLDEKQTQPTDEEIAEGLIAYKAKLEFDKVEAQAKREAALTKLAALGLTAEDLKALNL
jgi:hypothetical protein